MKDSQSIGEIYGFRDKLVPEGFSDFMKNPQAELGSSEEAERAIIGRCVDCGFAKRVVQAATELVNDHPQSTLDLLATGKEIAYVHGKRWKIDYIPPTDLPNPREAVMKHLETLGTAPKGVRASKIRGVVGVEFVDVDEKVSLRAKVLQELLQRVEDCNGCEGRTCEALLESFLKDQLSSGSEI